MFIADWSYFGAIGAAMTMLRIVWSAARAWAREPIKDAKIKELTSMIEMMEANQDRLEAAHARERTRWGLAADSSSGPRPSLQASNEIPTSSEPNK